MAKRARVKVKTPTTGGRMTRTQAAAEFTRKKQKQRVKMWKRRGLIAAGVAVVAYGGIGGWWLSHTGKIEKAMDVTSSAFWEMTADAGFRLDQIYLTGREHADVNVVKAAIDVKSGTPILSLRLDALQEKLQAIPEVKTATVTRTLPNKLNIALSERVPAAMWQREGKHVLVDADGIVLAGDKYRIDRPLPVIVGEDAPKHVRELVSLLDSAPAIKPQVAAAVRVGNRRWNVRLDHDITVLLPEDAPQDAWQRFAGLVEREGLLTKAIRSVDMRMEDRVFILPTEQQQSPITLTTARDT